MKRKLFFDCNETKIVDVVSNEIFAGRNDASNLGIISLKDLLFRQVFAGWAGNDSKYDDVTSLLKDNCERNVFIDGNWT